MSSCSHRYKTANKRGNVRTTYQWGAFENHCCSGKAKGVMCVSVAFSYPVCNAHAPYCHLWPVPLYKAFPHYLINGTIFEKSY